VLKKKDGREIMVAALKKNVHGTDAHLLEPSFSQLGATDLVLWPSGLTENYWQRAKGSISLKNVNACFKPHAKEIFAIFTGVVRKCMEREMPI
jgi:hypothetical protein